MAEGVLRQAAGDFIDVQSAGSKPAGYVHPKAIEVMKEIGIDISSHTSKHMNEFLNRKVEYGHYRVRKCRPSLPDVSRPSEPLPLGL